MGRNEHTYGPLICTVYNRGMARLARHAVALKLSTGGDALHGPAWVKGVTEGIGVGGAAVLFEALGTEGLRALAAGLTYHELRAWIHRHDDDGALALLAALDGCGITGAALAGAHALGGAPAVAALLAPLRLIAALRKDLRPL